MYRIIGADGNEYGPVTTDQLKQWAAENRVNAQTRVKPESAADWQLLGTLPEFAAVVNADPIGVPTLPGAPARTSGLAIASLVCSVLGIFTCGITSLVGLVLGIIALVKIGNSQGRLTGKGLAIGGIAVAAFLPLIAIVVAIALPAFVKAKERAQTIYCVNNVKQLCLATRLYAADHDDILPLAEHWCDAITNRVHSMTVFRCRTEPDSRCSFAMNAKLDGKKDNEVDPETVMFFESDAGWNANGGLELLTPHKHSDSQDVAIIGFADGSVRQVKQTELDSLRWDP